MRTGSPPRAGSKKPKWNTRSAAIRRTVIAITGVPRTLIRLVAYVDQRNSGIRNQVIPGARMRWMVTMKLRPVRIDENPTMKIPSAVGTTLLVEDTVLNGV